MPPDNRVLVVGTTPDYIDWIRRVCPQRCLYVTDKNIRRNAKGPSPGPGEEICCDLTDIEQARQAVIAHNQQWGTTIDGVACFDCESLAPAALLAQSMSLPFPSPEAIANCRDKLTAKTLWRQSGLSAPQAAPVRKADDVIYFLRNHEKECVLKPVSGSGSELVFHCRSEDECRHAFSFLCEGLCRRAEHRLYRNASADSTSMMVEEFIAGAEFSCDFLLENNRVALIRLARKIPAAATAPFGTAMGYVLIDSLPGVDLLHFTRNLARGAMALGISRNICMADFMVREGEIILLEITPRPGGDCLPPLIRHALGIDMLVLTLDLAQNRSLCLDSLSPPRFLAGLRVHAARGGVLKKIHWDAIALDPRVREIIPLRLAGDTIRMPPEDYESFLLGNIIIAPKNSNEVEDECRLLLNRLTVEIGT